MAEEVDRLQFCLFLTFFFLNFSAFFLNLLCVIFYKHNFIFFHYHLDSDCAFFWNYMKGRLILCTGVGAIFCFYMYLVMNKRLYIKTNSLIYDSIIFINANDKSPLKIDNKIKNTKIFILNFIYYISWVLLLFYELFFVGADASVAGNLLEESKCTFSRQNVLDIADNVHFQMGSIYMHHQNTTSFEELDNVLSAAAIMSFNNDFNASTSSFGARVDEKVVYLNQIAKYLKLSVIFNLAMGVSNFCITFLLLIVVLMTKKFLPQKSGDMTANPSLSPGTQILIDLAQTPSSLVAEMASASRYSSNEKEI